MPNNPAESILSVLMKANATNDAQTLIEAMLTIQTQLSEIQENQRKIMKTLRSMGIEQRSRLSDLKKTTQVLLKNTHDKLSDKLNELQDSVDEQYVDDMNMDDDFTMASDLDLFK